MKRACILTVAGSDPSGGAGIQADIKTITVLGGFAMTVITALTFQNTCSVEGFYAVPPGYVAWQFDVVAKDLPIDALKTGMLPTGATVEVVAEKIRNYKIEKVVVDPVRMAKRGEALMDEEAFASLKKNLLPLAFVVTPNVPEAENLTGLVISNLEDMKRAAFIIHQMGAKNVVVKGGHLEHPLETALDLLYDGRGFHELVAPRIKTKNTHGTGCTYASALAYALAVGKGVYEAAHFAKCYVTEAIRNALSCGMGQGPLDHLSPLWDGGVLRKFD